jgi:hypothetical protein
VCTSSTTTDIARIALSDSRRRSPDHTSGSLLRAGSIASAARIDSADWFTSTARPHEGDRVCAPHNVSGAGPYGRPSARRGVAPKVRGETARQWSGRRDRRADRLVGREVLGAGRLDFKVGARFPLAQADAALARAIAGGGGAVALEP